MERLKKQLYDMPLRRALICSVAVTVALVLAAGGLTVGLGTAFMRWLLPNEEDFYLNVAVCYRDRTETDFFMLLSPGDDILNFIAEGAWETETAGAETDTGKGAGTETSAGKEAAEEKWAASSLVIENHGFTEQIRRQDLDLSPTTCETRLRLFADIRNICRSAGRPVCWRMS